MKATIPPTEKENFLNPPERILKEIFQAQKTIKETEKWIEELKSELDQHLHLGMIPDVYSSNGVKATRVTKQGKWIYSDSVNELEKEQKQEINLMKEDEKQKRIAVQEPPTLYWRVTKHAQ
jgi:broad specificity polyphosphatase/5'/3'-nucleotidase SurE